MVATKHVSGRFEGGRLASRRARAAAMAVAVFGWSQVGSAQIATWIGAGDGINWNDGANWQGGATPGYGTLIFGTTGAGSLNQNLGNPLSMHRIDFTGSASYTLGGNQVDFFDFSGQQARIENQSSASQTIDFTINFAATAGGNWGELNPLNGDLRVGAVTVTGSGVNSVQVFGGNGFTLTFGGVLSGTGKELIINGASNVAFEAANTYSGDTYINAGTLQFRSGGSAASSTIRVGASSGTSPATMSLVNATGGQGLGNVLVVRAGSSGVKTIKSTNTSGTNTLSGNIFLDADVTVSSDNAGGTFALTGATIDLKNQTMTVTGSGDTNISGGLTDSTGTGKIIKSGSGVLTLASGNTHSGSITINAGTVSAAADSAFGTVAGDNAVTFAGGALRATSSFTLASTRNPQFNVGGGTYDVATGQTLTVAGIQKGTAGYNKTGAGTVALTSTASTVSGPISITGGTLQIISSGAIGSTAVGAGNITIDGGTLRNASTGAAVTWLTGNRGIIIGSSGGTIDVGGTDTTIHIYTSGAITGSGNTLTKSGGGIFRNTTPTSITFTKLVVTGGLYQAAADNFFGAVPGGFLADAITLDGGGLSVNSGMAFSNNRGITIGPSGGTFSATSTGTIGAIISGTGAFTKANTGILSLSGVNTFAGGINFNDGRLNLNGNSAAGTGSVNVAPGADELTTSAVGITIANNVVLASGAAPKFYATSGNSITMNGVISGGGGLLRDDTGAGTMTLNGDNSFAGGLSITSRGGIFSGHRNAAGTGVLGLGGGAAPANPITIQSNTDLTGLNAMPNAVSLNQNFTIAGSNGLEFSGPITLGAATRTVTVTNSAATIFSGNIGGPAGVGLTKAGAGVLTLSGNNNYTGPTSVTGGTLRVNGTHTGGGAYSVSAGATLGGSGTTSGNLSVNGTLAPGASIGTLTVNGNVTINTGADLTIEVDVTPLTSPGGSADTLAVNGTVTLGDGVTPSTYPNLQFVFTPAVIGSVTPGKTFVIVLNDGVDPVAGEFAGHPDGTTIGSGLLQYAIDYQYDFATSSFNAGNDIAVTFTEVPEPTSAAVFAAAAGLILRRRRR